MFDFFDNQKNPLMLLMNMMNEKDTEKTGEGAEDKSTEADPLGPMKQAFAMQMQMMQLMQSLCMMPLQLMQSLIEMLEAGLCERSASEKGASEGKQGGFKLGNMEIPPRLLSLLMQLDMSPENLSKLQRALDFLFDALPQPKNEPSEREESK